MRREHMFERRLSPESGLRLNLAGDLLMLAGASLLAALDDGNLHWKVGTVMAATAWVLWICASRVLNQYKSSSGRGLLGDVVLTVVLLLAVIVPMALFRYVSPRYATTTEITRFLVTLVPAVLGMRVVAVGTRLWRSRPTQQVLVLGAGSLGRLTEREITDSGKRRAVMGHLRFDDELDSERLGAPVLGTVGELEAVLRDRIVNEVYIASTRPGHRDVTQAAIGTCERFGVPFALPAGGYRFARATPACKNAIPDGYVHFLSVQYKPIQWGLKRLLDIVVSGAALVLLAPLLALTATVVKLTSKGPILFRQERVGLNGRTFPMLKFRSMVVNAEKLKAALMARNERSGPVFKIADDPRITAVGRFIRKYSIDELPQLVNVLRGDMSLVGPRPALPCEVAKYEAWQRRRLSVRPGLTCVWQVSGRNQVSFGTWMLLDMRYIDHWSFWADLRLILRTVPVVVLGRGAS
jgi:exopolysaccharide biosynthesis polyprenyl glycosylphosphotransferase